MFLKANAAYDVYALGISILMIEYEWNEDAFDLIDVCFEDA